MKVENLVRLSFSILFVLSVTISAAAFAYNYEVISLLYDHNINESARLFPVLMGCFVAISTTYVFGTLLTANGNLRQLNYLAFAGMLLNLGLNLVLIPKYGAYGSAWASLVTQSLMAVLQVVLCFIYFKFTIRYRYLLKLVIFLAGVFGAAEFSSALSFDWIINLGIMIAISLLLAALLRLLNVAHFFRILKDRTVQV